MPQVTLPHLASQVIDWKPPKPRA